MKKVYLVLTGIVCLFLISLIAVAAGNINKSKDEPMESTLKTPVKHFLEKTENVLKKEELEKVQNFFSSDYYGGFGELQNDIEDNWRGEQLIN